jgi:ferredoxin
VSEEIANPTSGELAINTDKCQGHGRCYSLFPDLFECGDDNGNGRVLVQHVEGDQYQSALQAVNGCPEDAISIRTEQ